MPRINWSYIAEKASLLSFRKSSLTTKWNGRGYCHWKTGGEIEPPTLYWHQSVSRMVTNTLLTPAGGASSYQHTIDTDWWHKQIPAKYWHQSMARMIPNTLLTPKTMTLYVLRITPFYSTWSNGKRPKQTVMQTSLVWKSNSQHFLRLSLSWKNWRKMGITLCMCSTARGWGTITKSNWVIGFQVNLLMSESFHTLTTVSIVYILASLSSGVEKVYNMSTIIPLSYNKDLKCLIVKECYLDHNHRTGENVYRQYPLARRLLKEESKETTDMERYWSYNPGWLHIVPKAQ